MALSLSIAAAAFTLPAAPHLAGGLALQRAPPAPRMMFGGGGGDKDGEGGGFMDKIKQAQQMFNPEMMKKYSEVGMKVQQLQEELAATEVECATNDGSVVVKVSGTQVPNSVVVSEELVAKGAEACSAELTAALKSAHAKSGGYAQQKMQDLYKDMGLGDGPPAGP